MVCESSQVIRGDFSNISWLMAQSCVDFDYGGDQLKTLLQKSGFPWVLCNYLQEFAPREITSILQPQNLLVGTHSYIVRTIRGVRFGLFGLGGTDWPALCPNLPPCRVEDPATAAKTMASHLRQVLKCDIVIAITHMRLAEDMKVAGATSASDDSHVDILLGGHDHETVCRVLGDTCSDASRIWQGSANENVTHEGRVTARTGKIRIVKSGSDFKGFSHIRMVVHRNPKGKVSLVKTIGEQNNNARAKVL